MGGTGASTTAGPSASDGRGLLDRRVRRRLDGRSGVLDATLVGRLDRCLGRTASGVRLHGLDGLDAARPARPAPPAPRRAARPARRARRSVTVVGVDGLSVDRRRRRSVASSWASSVASSEGSSSRATSWACSTASTASRWATAASADRLVGDLPRPDGLDQGCGGDELTGRGRSPAWRPGRRPPRAWSAASWATCASAASFAARATARSATKAACSTVSTMSASVRESTVPGTVGSADVETPGSGGRCRRSRAAVRRSVGPVGLPSGSVGTVGTAGRLSGPAG